MRKSHFNLAENLHSGRSYLITAVHIKSFATELIWILYHRSRKSLCSTLVLQLYFTNFLFLYMMFVFQLAKRLILMHKIRTKEEEQVET